MKIRSLFSRGPDKKPVSTKTKAAGAGLAGVLALTTVVVSSGLTIGQGGTSTGPADPEPGLHNIWVDDGGGTCAGGRSATKISFAAAASPDRICGTLDVAWDAVNAGDTIGVDDGTYTTNETISGDKASDTTFVGVDRDTTIIQEEIVLDANHIVFQDVTFDSVASHGWAFRVQGNNITWNNVVAEGQFITVELFSSPANFTWDGGSIGEAGDTPGERCDGDGQPLEMHGGDGHIIRNLTVWPQAGGDSCGVDGFHEEDFRIHSSNTTIENVVFKDGSSVNRNGGSGKIFLSGTGVDNLLIRNVIFGPVHTSSNNAMDANVSSCSMTIAYSTFTTEGTNLGLCESVTLIHNLGPNAPGVPVTGILSAGNAAIDAAAATCSSDTGGVDYEGESRPVGSACDKGADEYTP